MSNNTIVARTVLGDALRRLGDLLDGAPSILAAANRHDGNHWLHFYVTTAEGVEKIGEDLGFPVDRYPNPETGHLHTKVTVTVGPVAAVFLSITEERELHRPVDVTETIEEQEQ